MMKRINTFVYGSLKMAAVLTLINMMAVFVSAQYTPDQILKVEPTQKDVPVDIPVANEVAQCKIIEFSEGNYRGVCLTKPDGTTPLRVWCAPEGARTVEQVRFFRNGIEIFRDILTSDRQCRWLNDQGSRWANLNEDKAITSWKAITPEEATAEIAAALAAGDLDRYKRVSVSRDDLKELGISGNLLSAVLERVNSVDAKFAEFARSLKIPAKTQWAAFNGNKPALLPQGANGFAQDVPAYFNSSVVLVNKENTAQSHQIYIGDLIKIGDVWKIVGLPVGEPFGKSGGDLAVSSVFFPTQSEAGGANGTGNYNLLAEQLNEMYKNLETVSAEEYPALCEKTYTTLLTLAAQNPKEENELATQASDLLFNAIQKGLFPQGAGKLAELFDTYKNHSNQELVSHIKLRQIEAEYFLKTQTSPPPKKSDLEKAQNKHTEDLNAFAETYPKTSAGGLTLMYLAQDQEYLQEDDQAIARYATVAKNFSNTEIGRKAAGAIRRIESAGKVWSLPKWKYLEGGEFNLDEFKGKPLVIFFWASWSSDSISSLIQIHEKKKNFNIVGISLDDTPEKAAAFIKQSGKAIPWKNICEKGGFSGACAIEAGVQNVPLMVFIDAEGKVVRPNISTVSELEVLLNH
ncbi:MAG: TlpA disulfide reductase family protein [Planctomycetia bacterium]|nr:TlpA disulfide reductase family protein [Planctomycetia bacterium]